LPVVLEFIASGGIAFGGSADLAFTTAPVGSGGITFGGSANVAFTRIILPSGGITFGGSADVSFGIAEPVGGNIAFGGAADVAFTKVITGSGGITFGGFAWSGPGYKFTFEVGGPGFMLHDLVLAQRVDYDAAGGKLLVYRVIGEVVVLDAEGEATVAILDGEEYLAGFGEGIEFVRFGNTTDTTRQGSIYLTADDTNAPYEDVIDGVKSYSDLGTLATIKVRLGKLTGINHPTFGQLQGYGLYAKDNIYLDGGKIILGPGSSVEWSYVTGSGKPQDNATVGADWGSNVTGRPTNLVALGDVPGYIQSTYLDSTEIRAPNITGNSILGGNIVASSGSTNTAGLTGEGSGDLAIRIWAGSTYANRGSAPFRVTQAGSVYMGDAVIEKAGSSSKVKIDNGQVTLYDWVGAWYQAGYIAGEASGINEYFNISADHYFRLRVTNNTYWNLVLEGGNLQIRGDTTDFLTSIAGTTMISIAHSTGFATGLDSDKLDGKHGTEVSNAGSSSAATNPTLKRTITLNGVTFDVACYS
jgi:hypothetical protein